MPNPTRVQQPDVRRHQDHDDGEGEQQALDQLDLASRWSSPRAPAELAPEAVDEAVERDPARRLDEDDVAVAQARDERVEGALDVGTRMTRAASRPAASAPVGDPGRARADDDQPSRPSAAAASPTTPVALVARLAELEHLAEDRDRAGRAARPAARAPRPTDRGEAL